MRPSSIAGEVLTHYPVRPWPDDLPDADPRPGECHRNAYMLALAHGRNLTVVKGYAQPLLGGWYGHWFCIDREGYVLDPTWRNGGRHYIGIETLDLDNLVDNTIATGHTSALDVEQRPTGTLVARLEAAVAAGRTVR